MLKRALLCLAAALLTAAPAHAQFGGGGGGGGGRRGGGGPQGHSAPTASPRSAAPSAEAPLEDIQIVGVIQALDPANDRVTIAYEPVEALNWTKGSMPFVVAKSSLLKDAKVGEKVRFKMQSQQISELKPY